MAIAHRNGRSCRLDRHGTAKATSDVGHGASLAIDDLRRGSNDGNFRQEKMNRRDARGFYATRRSPTPHFSVNVSPPKQARRSTASTDEKPRRAPLRAL
jgi:hypothetical protein